MAGSMFQVHCRVERDDFPYYTRSARARAGARAKKIAYAIKESARGFAPFLTGKLRGSIEVVKIGPYTYAIAPWEVDYAGFQEFGTSKMPAHPYMRPAAEKHKNDLIEGLKIDLNYASM